MARKQKQARKPVVALEELPRDTEELTSEEAETAKGGCYVPRQQAQTTDDGVSDILAGTGGSANGHVR